MSFRIPKIRQIFKHFYGYFHRAISDEEWHNCQLQNQIIFFFKNKMILLNPIIIFCLSSFLIGYFPDLMISSSSRRAFKKFVDASFQLLEFDPFLQNTGGIGVVTSPQLAFHLQLDASRPVR